MGNCISATSDSYTTKGQGELHKANGSALGGSESTQRPGAARPSNNRAGKSKLFPSNRNTAGIRLGGGIEHSNNNGDNNTVSDNPAAMAAKAAEERRQREMENNRIRSLHRAYANVEGAGASDDRDLVCKSMNVA
ncbi:hypothetical protein EV177_008293 [Coemansia sp. RSA 1804]|nr:hypothetical protein EV177_008293 [Coemansia sp. RSA 1804]